MVPITGLVNFNYRPFFIFRDLNLDHEQGEKGFVRSQVKSQEDEIKRRSFHDPYSSLERAVKTRTVKNVESNLDDVFPPPPPPEVPPSPPPPTEIPNVETRTIVYEPGSPTEISNYQMQTKGLYGFLKCISNSPAIKKRNPSSIPL